MSARPHRLLLAALLATSLVLAACGDSDGASDEPSDGGGRSDTEVTADPDNCPADALESTTEVTEVTVWHPYNALTQEALEEAAAAYNSSQDDVQVSVQAQGTYPELLKKYEDSLGNPENLPDVIFSEDTTLQYMIDSASVIPAADCVAADPDAEEFYGDLLPAVQNAYTVDGRLWAAAFGVSMPVMYVNNAHLEAAGLRTEDYPGTLDEVRTAAEAIEAAGIGGLESPVAMQLYAWFPENWLTGARQVLVNEGNGRDALATESEFDNERTGEVVGWMNAMAEDGLLKAYPYSSDISHFLALGQSSTSILIEGSRAITTVNAVVENSYAPSGEGELVDGVDVLEDTDLTGLDISVVPVPGVEEPGRGAVWGSAGFLVAGSDAAKVAGGWDFLKFFNETPNQVQWLLKGSYLPVTQTAQDSPEVTAYFSDTTAGQWLGVVNEQLLSLDPDFPGPVIGPYNEFRSGFHSMLDEVVLGNEDPSAGISSLDESFQRELDRYTDELG